jgi:DNA adenine methylase
MEVIMSNVKRPLVRYHGGKWRIAPWITSFFPQHKTYVEPYGGGGSILLYNDLDGEIVNLFKVVRDDGEELIRRIRFTPYARNEFSRAFRHDTDDPIERARKTLIKSFMGIASTGVLGTDKQNTGFRAKTGNRAQTAAMDWKHLPESLDRIISRLQGVVLENRPALEIIEKYDDTDTLFYVDPPYLAATRDRGKDYRFELSESDHVQLAERLQQVQGMVVLSGYQNDLYKELYHKWQTSIRHTVAHGAIPRTEVLWMKGVDLGLFSHLNSWGDYGI